MRDNLIDKLQEANMLYFVLGSLISADSLVDVNACHKALTSWKISNGISRHQTEG